MHITGGFRGHLIPLPSWYLTSTLGRLEDRHDIRRISLEGEGSPSFAVPCTRSRWNLQYARTWQTYADSHFSAVSMPTTKP